MNFNQLTVWLLYLCLIATTAFGEVHLSGHSASEKQLALLSGLLSNLNIPHEKNIRSITEAYQRWRRQPGQERWEASSLIYSQKQTDKAIEHLKALGFIDEYKPETTSFDYALLLGATVSIMTSRLKQLVKMWEEGIRFKTLVFQSGQRPLNPEVDDIEGLITRIIAPDASQKAREQARPVTEIEALRMIYLSTDMPEEMRKLTIEITNNPRVWQEGRWQRGNTRDGIELWGQSSPKPGKVLIVSCQPHIHYQREVILQELPAGFSVDATGEKASSNTRLSVYLDSLALWLYNLQQRTNLLSVN